MKRLWPILFLVLGCATSNAPVLVPFADGDSWMLRQPLRYESIVVPAGFVTDLASVPSAFCTLLPASGRYLSAAIVHDFLYWDQSCSREDADRVFLRAMTDAEVPVLKRDALYAGARVAGAIPWARNADEKRDGYVQIVPKDKRDFPANVTWKNYRSQLRAGGAVEPKYEKPVCQ